MRMVRGSFSRPSDGGGRDTPRGFCYAAPAGAREVHPGRRPVEIEVEKWLFPRAK